MPGLLDEAAERLVWVVLADDPQARRAVFARFGIGPFAGAEPVGEARAAAAGGVSVGDVTVALARVRRVARSSGVPAALRVAVLSLRAALPGTAAGLALALHRDGVTRGVLHPRAVLVLAALWDTPAPALHAGRRLPAAIEVLGEGGRLPALPGLLVEVHRFGVLGLEQALRLPAWPGHWGRAQRLDLLEAVGLRQPGSPVVWDQAGLTWPRRPVERLLAACGPLPVRDVHAGLLRARHAWPSQVQVPTCELLLAWAHEAPGLLPDPETAVRAVGDHSLTGTVVLGLAGPPRLARQLLTPSDRVLLPVLRRRRAGVPSADLLALLLQVGLYRTRGAAQVELARTPYLQPVRHGSTWSQRLLQPTAPPVEDGPAVPPSDSQPSTRLPQLIRLEAVAEALDVDTPHVERLVRRGELPALRADAGARGASRRTPCRPGWRQPASGPGPSSPSSHPPRLTRANRHPPRSPTHRPEARSPNRHAETLARQQEQSRAS